MIDPTKDCEAEINGRFCPVMLLFALGNDTPFGFHAQVDGVHCMFSMNDPEARTLRNVAPPKPEPVLREAWIALYADGCASGFNKTKTGCENSTLKHERVECRRIAWMSDGSPVPGGEVTRATVEALAEQRKELIAERDAFKDMAKRREAERDSLKAEVERLTSVLRTANPDARMKQVQDELARIRPVYDAAVEWCDAVSISGGSTALTRLKDAVRAALGLERGEDKMKLTTPVTMPLWVWLFMASAVVADTAALIWRLL